MPKFKTEEVPRVPVVIGAELGEVYFIEKDAKAEREKLRGEFFKAATATFTPERLAQKTVIPPSDVSTEEAGRAYAEQYNEGWLVIEAEEGDKGTWAFLLREDPALKPYQAIVEVEGGIVDHKDPDVVHPGYSITRSITSGSPMLDTERLSVLDPELYERATIVANYDLLSDLLYNAGVDLEAIDRRLNGSNLPRVPRSPDDLSDEDREAIKDYSFEGPRGAKLLVRYAKEEEIGEG